MTPRRGLRLGLGLTLAALVAVAVFIERADRDEPDRRPAPAQAPTAEREAPAPYVERAVYSPSAPAPTVDETAEPPPARRAPPPLASGKISREDYEIEYRNAVCACQTRNCVRDLQAGFVARLSSIDRKQPSTDAVREASRQRRACIERLPEAS
jgi:hypothetical protein